MNKKQIIGLIAAALVFAFVCSVSMIVRSKFADATDSLLNSAGDTLSGLFGGSGSAAWEEKDPYIGLLNIEGTIQASSGSLLEGSGSYHHEAVLSSIDAMMDSDMNRGILLFLNSPGGTVYESDEVYLKLMEYKQKTNRPIWAYFASEACSGAYYISCAADRIYANRNTWTGSIGVIISYVNYAKLAEKLGIKEVNIVSGSNKAMGSAMEELTDEQTTIFQSLVDDAYDQFVSIVAEGRHLSETTVRTLADGRVYTAKQALANGLIDKILSYEDALAEIQAEAGEGVSIVDCNGYASPSILDEILGLFSSVQNGKSDLQLLKEAMENGGRGELMYLAK